MYTSCFARANLLQTSVKACSCSRKSYPIKYRPVPFPPPWPGVNIPQCRKLPSLAVPVQTLATPMASFLPSTTGSGWSGHIPLWLNPRQVRRRETPTAARTPIPGSTKMTPKTHRVLRPEAAGSRHSPPHMRETKRDSEVDPLVRLQLPEGRDCLFSREEEEGRGKG